MTQEQKFTAHLKNDSSFADLTQCSYEDKQIVFKSGYANFEYHAKKKILYNLLVLFEKFKKLDRLSISIPAYDATNILQTYSTSIERKTFFEFIIDKIQHKKGDISDVNTFMHKNTVEAFAKEFIFTQPF